MGDRSNVNIITDKLEDKYLLLNIYSHWGGAEAQLKALEKTEEVLERAKFDSSYFSRAIIRTVTEGDDGATGSGVSPKVVETLEKAYQMTEDNEHDILTIDLVNQELVLYRHYGGYYGIPETAEIVAKTNLSKQGIQEMTLEFNKTLQYT